MNWNTLFARSGKSSVETISKILNDYGFRKTFKIFNVVGTNGKGSVSSFLAQGFASTGARVGLFTSPHLIRPNERIIVNGEAITDEQFATIYQRFYHLPLNFFAFTYLVAMMHFMETECDIVVLEAGIGGNKDCTKAIPGDWGCVTSIDLDHTEMLGNTVSAIAIDKAGIGHDAMRFFVPSSLDKKLQAIFCKRMPKTKIINNRASTYKMRNRLFAQGVLHCLDITFTNFQVPNGRTQIIEHNGLQAILDVGHNYDGIKNTLQQIASEGVKFEKVVLMLKRTKDCENIIELFGGVEVVVYQKDDNFYSPHELGCPPITDPHKELQEMAKNTLFIGSFQLIGTLLKQVTNQGSFKSPKDNQPSSPQSPTNFFTKIGAWLRNQFRISIYEITLMGLLIGLWTISALPIFSIDFGFMHIGITYIWPILLGLTMRPLVALIAAIIGDNLALLASGSGFGMWMPEYAIIAPGIAMVCALLKKVVTSPPSRAWWVFIGLATLVTSLGCLLVIVAESNFVKGGTNPESAFDFHSSLSKIIISLSYAVMMGMQLGLIVAYLITRRRQSTVSGNRLKMIISFYALVSVIVMLFVWVWGPFAQIRFLIIYGGQNHAYFRHYDLFLIPRVLKTPFILVLYSLFIVPIYSAHQVILQRTSRVNRWV